MAESAYHWDALRKERILQRKRDAQRRMQEGGSSEKKDFDFECLQKEHAKSRRPANDLGAASLRSKYKTELDPIAHSGVVFKEVVHDPNYKYRVQRFSRCPPLHVDPVYSVMYPGSFSYSS